jgi:uncharacterized membrane protein YjjB (DUF3815 family)
LARVRKALVAAVAAGLAAGIAVLVKAGSVDDNTIGQAIGAFAVAAVAAGLATWRVPNAPAA